MSRFFRFFRRRRDDERGAVLVLTGMSLILILAAGAMGVDIGFTVYGQRTAQAMADTAALDLAQNLPAIDAQSSQAAMQTYINTLLAGVDTDNGSHTQLSATPGIWMNGAFQTVPAGCLGSVFITAPTACNAIAIRAVQPVPQPFWGGFNPTSGRSTYAAWTPLDWFSIGSYLASINTQQSAVLNVLLGELGSASVTAVGYQGLANTYVSLNDLVTASGGVLTTSNVLTTTITGSQWLTILSNAVANQVAQLNCSSTPTALPCEANTGLSALHFNASTSAELCQMISINGSTCTNGSVSTQGLNSSINLLQMLTSEAELANGSSALNVTSALSIPNVTSASLYLTLVQPAGDGWGTPGSYTSASPCPAPSGQTSACAYTAQVTSDLKLTVTSLLGQGINVDIPLSGAIGYATLASMSCTTAQVFQNATINVATTAATGTVTENGTSLGTLTINGVSPQQTGTFSTVPPTTSSVSLGTNPRKFGSTTPTLNYSSSLGTLGLDTNLLNLLTVNLPSVLGPVLQVTGASVGGAQVTDTKVKCGVVSLVG